MRKVKAEAFSFPMRRDPITNAILPIYRYEEHAEGFKETMLQHEATFREQVRELHRLYQVQLLMMSEVKVNHFVRASSNRTVVFPFIFKQLNGSLEEDASNNARLCWDTMVNGSVYNNMTSLSFDQECCAEDYMDDRFPEGTVSDNRESELINMGLESDWGHGFAFRPRHPLTFLGNIQANRLMEKNSPISSKSSEINLLDSLPLVSNGDLNRPLELGSLKIMDMDTELTLSTHSDKRSEEKTASPRQIQRSNGPQFERRSPGQLRDNVTLFEDLNRNAMNDEQDNDGLSGLTPVKVVNRNSSDCIQNEDKGGQREPSMPCKALEVEMQENEQSTHKVFGYGSVSRSFQDSETYSSFSRNLNTKRTDHCFAFRDGNAISKYEFESVRGTNANRFGLPSQVITEGNIFTHENRGKDEHWCKIMDS